MITFSIVSYFDPFGDGKSNRKVFKREFFNTEKSKEEIATIFTKINDSAGYYGQKAIIFKNYKRTKKF